jgi:hypothetical protein
MVGMVGTRDLETVNNTTAGRPASPNKVRLGDRVRQPSFGVVCDGEAWFVHGDVCMHIYTHLSAVVGCLSRACVCAAFCTAVIRTQDSGRRCTQHVLFFRSIDGWRSLLLVAIRVAMEGVKLLMVAHLK